MPLVLSGSTGITSDNIASLAASKLTGQVADANAPSGSVLQVVQIEPSPLTINVASTGSNTANLTTSNTTLVFSGSITPSSTSNKILIMFKSSVDAIGLNSEEYISVFRGSTLVSATTWYRRVNGDEPYTHVINYLDSPNTTSNVQYDIRAAHNASGVTLAFNRSVNAASTNAFNKNTTLILMEISA